MKNRDFTIKGINFHLNDNFPRGYKPARAEYEGKYYIMYEDGERWFPMGITVDSKKEAIEILKRKAKNHFSPFDY